MRRRSVSSCVSPGPRVPMPPPSCDMALPRPVSRGSMYSSCASSTCSWPSRVRAWRAKMSRISCVRSMTLQGRAFSRLRSWVGLRSWSTMATSACGRMPRPRKSLRPCRCRLSVAGSALGRCCSTSAATRAPALITSSRNSARCESSSRRAGCTAVVDAAALRACAAPRVRAFLGGPMTTVTSNARSAVVPVAFTGIELRRACFPGRVRSRKPPARPAAA